ncbi:hypothetical protein LS482_03695 [Sinomicrobium kalidii]|uniref:hypothetical protein n=1 Tax=Sinomicrobium kalidii TaxID=2900738 RepID=UPI001E3CE48D|nr:hypothetical protein [Sinomicrobium kalidii]UGU16981.1 hypothetical protein LS482_03695 [Sinomicrobium kalidii]
MKSFGIFLKKGLVILFLTCAVPAFAQIVAPVPTTPVSTPENLDVGSLTNNTLPVTTINDAVLFYDPSTSGPSITLTASLDDGQGNTFTGYEWYNITTDGTTETENLIAGEATQNLTLTQLAPGYHKFRVYGLVDDGSVICQSDDFEDIILFVLSPLTVDTAFDTNGNPLAYCATDVPATPIELSVTSLNADYSANTNGYANPAGNDFEVSYAWYAVKDGDTVNPIDLATTTDTYSVTLTDPGTYTFYVEVEYVVKDKGSRDYVTYTGNVQDAGVDLEIVVSPTPGAPTITIGSVTD